MLVQNILKDVVFTLFLVLIYSVFFSFFVFLYNFNKWNSEIGTGRAQGGVNFCIELHYTAFFQKKINKWYFCFCFELANKHVWHQAGNWYFGVIKIKLKEWYKIQFCYKSWAAGCNNYWTHHLVINKLFCTLRSKSEYKEESFFLIHFGSFFTINENERLDQFFHAFIVGRSILWWEEIVYKL